jgi:hypothetical protein
MSIPVGITTKSKRTGAFGQFQVDGIVQFVNHWLGQVIEVGRELFLERSKMQVVLQYDVHVGARA